MISMNVVEFFTLFLISLAAFVWFLILPTIGLLYVVGFLK